MKYAIKTLLKDLFTTTRAAAAAINYQHCLDVCLYVCSRSSRCRHLHPKDLKRLNYTLSGHFDRQGQTRMALKTAGFLAAIERGAHFIFQANPGMNHFQGDQMKKSQKRPI